MQCQFPKAPRNNSHKKKSYIQNPKRIKSRNKDGEIRNKINLYEHQGSYNLNMPLRMLEYLGRLYGGYVKKNGGLEAGLDRAAAGTV